MTESASRPTVVLVHGAYADSSSWDDVIALLQADDHPVIAVPNQLRGLLADAAYVRSVLESVEGEIVLAGHSYGGSVITQAAAGVASVKALIYIAAFIPVVGENIADIDGRFPGSKLGTNTLTRSYPLPDGGSGTDIYIRPELFRETFGADLPESRTALMAVTQRPISTLAVTERATAAAWQTVPSWCVVSVQDQALPVAAQRFMAERAGATVRGLDSSHAVPVAHPSVVADVIRQAASTATA